MRHDVVLFSLAVCGVLSIVFLTLWAIRRKEVAYGWLGAMYLFMVLTGIDHVKASPWPFADNHGWQIAITITYFLYSGCHSMFVLRYCGRRWPRTEMMLWIAIALVSASFLLLPYTMIRTSQNVAALLALAINTTRMIVFVVFAWRDGGWDKWLLAGCGVVFYVVGMRDLLVFIHAIDSTFYIAPFNAIAINLCMAIVLAWHFVRSLHRIEGFNDELRGKIAEARSELATTLQRQHELELVQSRLGERLSLAHDLHDGLGGMLIGNIAELEQAPENMPSRAVLDMMKELRDDLRLIIDTASAQHYGKHSLAELLAPLRHRMSRMFEVRGIESRWRADDLENTYLITTHSLDLLRVLQEALANVLKHSGAQHVDIDLIEKNGTLHLEVSDDGVGLKSTSESNSGTGLRSMQIRARRLGAALSVGSETGGTVVRLSMPLPAKPGC
jgi:signal transduction histidine kinase